MRRVRVGSVSYAAIRNVRSINGRSSARREASVVLELMRGADLEATSRKHRVTVATLTQWRDRFLAVGEASMKSREVALDDEEGRRLTSVVAGLSVDNEVVAARRSPDWSLLESETMSRTLSPSSKRSYGVARVIAICTCGIVPGKSVARRFSRRFGCTTLFGRSPLGILSQLLYRI
jgi:hypothetical protein